MSKIACPKCGNDDRETITATYVEAVTADDLVVEREAWVEWLELAIADRARSGLDEVLDNVPDWSAKPDPEHLDCVCGFCGAEYRKAVGDGITFHISDPVWKSAARALT